jgi:hypothetical protein
VLSQPGLDTEMNQSSPAKISSSVVAALGRCQFAEMLVEINRFEQSGFETWVLCPGMQFGSMLKWWGDHGQRDFAHEGIDLSLFAGRDGDIHRVDVNIEIPVITNGRVKAIFTDYLGKAVVVEHEISGVEDGNILSVYAHTDPRNAIEVGTDLIQGDIIASLADTSRLKSGIAPHLHLTLGVPSRDLTYDPFVWNIMRDASRVRLLDPLAHINLPIVMADSQAPCCLAL